MGEITLDRLYRATKQVELPDGTTIVVRALGDAERRAVGMAALRFSILTDKALGDETSDEYIVHLLPLQLAERETLIDVVLEFRRGVLYQEAAKQFPNQFLPHPEDATPEEMKEVEERRAESEKTIEEKRTGYIEKGLEEHRAKLDKIEDGQLRKEATQRKRQVISLDSASREEMYQSVYYGTIRPEGTKYFASVDEVRALDSQVLMKLLREQREVDVLDVWALTKIGSGRNPERLVETHQEPQPEPQ